MKKSHIAFAIFLILPIKANAANDCSPTEIANNTCFDCGATASDLCTARKDGTKLTITGSGYMKDYLPQEDPAPWGNVAQVDMSGIKSIGMYSFIDSDEVTELTIPASVERLNTGALQGMRMLEKVFFEEGSNLKRIEGAALQSTPKLMEFNMPDGVEYIGYNQFYNSGITKLALPDSLFNENGKLNLQEIALKNGMTLYCPLERQQACEEYLKTAKGLARVDGVNTYLPLENITLETYQKFGSQYLYDGTFYDKVSDIAASRRAYKRIYTVNEANEVTGKKNSVSVRYK